MATTTNYGWATPDDTALVKDGASAIRTLGSSVDTTTKALNPSTTLGDIEYRSSTANTNTRLPIGTSGQVLSVSGGVPAWTTPTSGSMTLLSTTALSTNSVTVSSISGSYKNLVIQVIGAKVSSGSGALMMRLNGVTTSTYTHSFFGNGDSALNASTNQTKQNLYTGTGTAANNRIAQVTIQNYTNATSTKGWILNCDTGSLGTYIFGIGGSADITAAITSVTIFENDGNSFNGGSIYIYGVN